DADTLGEDLAVVGDADTTAGQRRADRADLDLVGCVDHDRSGGLGESVALEDDEADAAVEVTESGAERGPARHGIPHAATHGRAELGVDQPVEQGVLEPQPEAGASAVERLA